MFKKQIIKVSLVLFITASSTFSSKAQVSPPQDKINYALELIKYAYVDTVDGGKLTEEAIKAMVKELDPHSVYIPLSEMREMNEPLVGKFEGIGIQFNIHEDTIMVTQPIPGGPSEKLGIRAGDRIVKIDGVNVASAKITNNDVLKKLRGDKGTKVTVSIFRRDNPSLIDYTITRDNIPIFSMDAAYMVAPGIGYIKISRFADSTVEEFKEALKKLKALGLKDLILDLQDNGGGYLNRAVELADEFLSPGKKIVYTRGRTSPPEDFMSSAVGGFEKGRLAILVNESSASASEIVSGAVQDWDRGLIIGRRSFGKGLVQKPFGLPDGSAIRLTVAHYYTPSGRCIQKPYKLGEDDEYDMDFSNRVKNGELFNPDSIKFSDSTNYFTNNKRIVKGGGGIMPDIFVPLDTNGTSTYFTDIRRKNVLGDFTLSYTDNHRDALLKQYPNINTFRSNFNVSDDLFNEFIAAGEKAGVKKDDVGLKTSERILKIDIKALIARNLWDTDAFFQVSNDLNDALQAAIKAIQNDTFSKMKITEK